VSALAGSDPELTLGRHCLALRQPWGRNLPFKSPPRVAAAAGL